MRIYEIAGAAVRKKVTMEGMDTSASDGAVRLATVAFGAPEEECDLAIRERAGLFPPHPDALATALADTTANAYPYRIERQQLEDAALHERRSAVGRRLRRETRPTTGSAVDRILAHDVRLMAGAVFFADQELVPAAPIDVGGIAPAAGAEATSGVVTIADCAGAMLDTAVRAGIVDALAEREQVLYGARDEASAHHADHGRRL